MDWPYLGREGTRGAEREGKTVKGSSLQEARRDTQSPSLHSGDFTGRGESLTALRQMWPLFSLLPQHTA